jgi:hypothetical protein
MLKKLFVSGKKISPKELREKYGSLTTSNESVQDLIDGAERQWKRYNDPEFQKCEFYERFNRIFKKK